MRAREIGGRPVVTLDTADDVAEVKDVLFSYASTSVVGFTLNKRGFLGSPMKEHLPWSRVSALGRDAVMIESRAELGAGDAAMEDAAASGERDVIGATVMTDGGTRLGSVEDVIVTAPPAWWVSRSTGRRSNATAPQPPCCSRSTTRWPCRARR